MFVQDINRNGYGKTSKRMTSWVFIGQLPSLDSKKHSLVRFRLVVESPTFFCIHCITQKRYRYILGKYHFIFCFIFYYTVFCRNKRSGRLMFRSNKENLQNTSKPIGFMYSPLWKITHQKPSVLCTPPFENHPIKTLKKYPYMFIHCYRKRNSVDYGGSFWSRLRNHNNYTSLG